VEHHLRYLYILKLNDGSYYVGQTNDLEHRLKEHQDDLTMSTGGKVPKLVWFEKWLGDRQGLNAEESELTKLATTRPYVIRRMITEWQKPLKLVDLSA
jgi:predicted GIY-YIG superfamily endonuclease